MVASTSGTIFNYMDIDSHLRDQDRAKVVKQMKPWYRSKTLWFNLIIGSLAALEANMGALSGFIRADWYAIICIVLPVGNAILRIVSTAKLTK